MDGDDLPRVDPSGLAALMVGAQSLFDFYSALTAAGFDPSSALFLVGQMMTTMLAAAATKADAPKADG